jgi:catechol 2,3-dioxygenase-like lactoylglutathione lyase family enzyme
VFCAALRSIIKLMAVIKSISALVFYVADLNKTKKFYEDLGFRFGEPKGDYLIAYINWFSVEFHPGEAKNTGGGAQTQLSVDDVDEFYEEIKSKGLRPVSEPEDTTMKRREFMLLDPDGYKLAFFTKK